MVKNRKGLIVVLIIIGLIMMMGRKEAVIPDYVEPDSSVSVMGELRVKLDATSFTPGQPAKVHWFICRDELCTDIVNSGYEPLTSAEIQDLNDRLTSQFKSVIYYMDFTAPSTAGTYYYEGTAETAAGLRVLQIDLDSNINFVHSNRFIVTEITDDPCIDYTDEEIISISHGDIRVTVRHIMTGTQPDCTEVSRSDIGFQVICDDGYTANIDGRDSTCTEISVCDPASTSDVYCDGNIAYFCSNGMPTTLDCSITGKVCSSTAGPVVFCSDCNIDSDCQSGYTCTVGHSCIPPTCIDNDGDGYGISGYTTGCQFTEVDCNDNNIAVHPHAHEYCNEIDDNCDGTVDEGCEDCSPSWTCTPWSDVTNVCGTRTCTDANQCGVVTGKPDEIKSCDEVPPIEEPICISNEDCLFYERCVEGECKIAGWVWMVGIFLVFVMAMGVMGKKK